MTSINSKKLMFGNRSTNAMKLLAYLAVLIPLASLIRAQLRRRYVPEEDDIQYKRYIDIELDNGTVVHHVDLMKGCDDYQRDVTPADVSFDLYNTVNTKDGRPYTFNLNNFDGRTFRKYFDESYNTLILAHGWRNSRNSPFSRLIKDACLGTFKINIIVTDWSSFADTIFYCKAKDAVPGVGQIVALLVTKIQNMYNLDGAHFYLVGHSLGAHVVGHAGKNVRKKVKYIAGLDPAAPLFLVSEETKRLADTDAKYVEVIHTNGALLGFQSAIGSADYYPNGGDKQLGCELEVAGKCSHSRAYLYLIESIIKGPKFYGYFCGNYKYYLQQRCINYPKGIMGRLFEHKLITVGDYYLKTKPDSPYGCGDVYMC